MTADPVGIALTDFRATTLPDSADLITWRIGDQGFDMRLSGKVPGRIATALRAELERDDEGGLLRGQPAEAFGLWAVHAGGRTVLDAVEQGLRLPRTRWTGRAGCCAISATCLPPPSCSSWTACSRGAAGPRTGLAMAFGPGLCAETFRFRLA